MTEQEVKAIVKLTVDELVKRKLVTADAYQSVLGVVERKLRAFFNNKGDGNGISSILSQLLSDPYLDIIFLQYRDGKTLEWIAEYFNVDVSTIKRNKKRLIYKIYELLEES